MFKNKSKNNTLPWREVNMVHFSEKYNISVEKLQISLLSNPENKINYKKNLNFPKIRSWDPKMGFIDVTAKNVDTLLDERLFRYICELWTFVGSITNLELFISKSNVALYA